MREPGEQPPPGLPPPETPARRRPDDPRWWSRSLGGATLVAIAAGLAAALVWAVFRAILELGPGALVVVALGGWGIGTAIREAHGPALLAAALGGLAWLVGLLLTWLLAMAVLPGSMRTFTERLAGTPFLDWLAPQFGLLEAAALVVSMGVATWTARRPSRAAGWTP